MFVYLTYRKHGHFWWDPCCMCLVLELFLDWLRQYVSPWVSTLLEIRRDKWRTAVHILKYQPPLQQLHPAIMHQWQEIAQTLMKRRDMDSPPCTVLPSLGCVCNAIRLRFHFKFYVLHFSQQFFFASSRLPGVVDISLFRLREKSQSKRSRKRRRTRGNQKCVARECSLNRHIIA